MTDFPAIDPPKCAVPSCCGEVSTSSISTCFHFALNVSDLNRSVEFYRKLFNAPPAKQYDDYAKFELTRPRLVFSLVPLPPASQGALSHLGFPVSSSDEVRATASRLEAAGLRVMCQDGTVCGYARQDKVWVADPDNNFWEIYVVHEDVAPDSVRSGHDGIPPETYARLGADHKLSVAERGDGEHKVFEHRVSDRFTGSISESDGTFDEVRLTGTFNSALTTDERSQFLNEAYRALKPGGIVTVHGLVANAEVGDSPNLPGVASLVKRVPLVKEPAVELFAAGFRGVTITKLPESPSFLQGTAEMREIKLAAFKPSGNPNGDNGTVMYKGPFAVVADEMGQRYLRGQRTSITASQCELLACSSAAKNFLFLDGRLQGDSTCKK